MSISVIIPTYNRKEVLRYTLLSLYKQTYQDKYEVIVVDDGSTDDTEQMVKSLSPPYQLKYFFKSRGADRESTKCRNIGAKNAQYDWLLFLDQDEIASPLLLQKLGQFNDKHVYVVGMNLFLSAEAFEKINDDVILNRFDEVMPSLRGKDGMAKTSTISNIGLVNKKKFFEVGGFDENFIGYGFHDADLQKRLKRFGTIQVHIHDANAFHISHDRGIVSIIAKEAYTEKEASGLYNTKQHYLTIIIPVRNQFDYFEYCFRSAYRAYSSDSVEIIVIDDGSIEPAKTQIRNLLKGFDEVKYFRNNNSIGLTKVWNMAARMASGHYILFSNSDTIYPPGSIAEMLRVLNLDEKIAVVGPSTSFCATKQRIEDFFPTRYDMLKEKGVEKIYQQVCSLSDKIKNVSHQKFEDMSDVSGFCFVVKERIFREDKIFFDESFEGPANEVDWQRQIRRKGNRICWAKGSYVHHFGRRTYYTEFGKSKADLMWAEAGLKLKEKWGKK